MIAAVALAGLREIDAGDDLAALLAEALPVPTTGDDVLVLAHKVVSKAEGRTRRLSEVIPGRRAHQLADALGKDPRHVQVILDETAEVRRAEHGVLIVLTHHGFVCANAGVDASNAPDGDTVILLPQDPDASARRIRAGLHAHRRAEPPAVLITDSFGRPWRHGQVDVGIGAAGLRVLEDWRGRLDHRGRELKATAIAVADELAAAADLARAKDAMQPAILVRGAARHVTPEDGPGIGPLLRAAAQDLFR